MLQIAGPAWIEECRKEWGEESVLFQTKVLGEISDAGADSIIKLSQVEQMAKNAADEGFNAEGQEEGGVDVARGGTDDTVMFHRKGLQIIEEKIIATPQLPEKAKLVYVADEVKRFFAYNKKLRIKIDDTGVGGGVTDILQADGYNIVPVNFGAEANEPDKYTNTVSEMWFEVGKIVHEIAWRGLGPAQGRAREQEAEGARQEGAPRGREQGRLQGPGLPEPGRGGRLPARVLQPQRERPAHQESRIVNLLARLRKAISGIDNPLARMILFGLSKNAVWTPADYTALSKAGYENCITVYACVNFIARAAAGIEWTATVGQEGRSGARHPQAPGPAE